MIKKTGCDPIDSILAAIAGASKSFRDSSQWNETDYSPDGLSPNDRIQKAADDAAEILRNEARGNPAYTSESLRLREQEGKTTTVITEMNQMLDTVLRTPPGKYICVDRYLLLNDKYLKLLDAARVVLDDGLLYHDLALVTSLRKVFHELES